MNLSLPSHNENGMVLITGLMLIATLSILSATAYMISSLELMISRNYLAEKKAFYMAEAAVEETRARLPDLLADAWENPQLEDGQWRAFLLGGEVSIQDFSGEGFDSYDANHLDHHLYSSFQSDMTCLAEARHMTERDLGADLNHDSDTDDLIFWGDGNGDFVSEENVASGMPMEWIMGVGMYGGAIRRAGVKIRPSPVFLAPPAALYANGHIYKTGGGGSAVGRGSGSGCVAIPDVMTTAKATNAEGKARSWPAGSSSPSRFVEISNAAYPVEETLARAESHASEIIAPGVYSFANYGGANQRVNLFFCPSDLTLSNLSGYGLLVVGGNLVISGNISWQGVIISKKGITIESGGAQEIRGAVISGGDVRITGAPDILYDCHITRRLQTAQADYHVAGWTHLQ